MILNPEKAEQNAIQQARYGSPVSPHKKRVKEMILSTTAGYIATGIVICCFFLIAAIGA